MKKTFHSNGKLLLTAEYLVIDGAKALALPSKYGQSLTVEPLKKTEIHWKSFDNAEKLWFSEKFNFSKGKFTTINTTKPGEITERLQQVLGVLQNLNPSLFQNNGFSLETHLEFPQNWGLGSSSTLIANLATWAKVNPYQLLTKTFGGSGYDIACAQSDSPLCYQIENEQYPKVETVHFDPAFKNDLFFVHLNQKQNSREGIKHYKNQDLSRKKEWIVEVSKLTDEFLTCPDLTTFKDLLKEHENLLASILRLPSVKQLRFPDFPGALKSLGAWGGDFILATGGEAEKSYFREKGFSTIVDYRKMVK